MEVSRQEVDALNALVTIRIGQPDYAEVVDKAIRNLKHKVNVPGFRPGNVPSGMIKKMYGRQVLSDEVGKLTVDALYKYLEENKVQYLGNPLPSIEHNNIDWENQNEFEFVYDLGLSPQFEISIPKNEKFTSYQVNVEDTILDEEIERLRGRFGRSINADEATEKDMIIGELEELNADGSPKEGGLKKQSYVILDKIDNEAVRSKFIGAKVNDVINFNPKQAYKDETTVSIYLGVKPEEVADLSDNFNMTVTTINRLAPAELDQEFFDKVFGPGNITDIESFRDKMREILKADLQSESNARLFNDIRAKILEQTLFALPDTFLKRWLKVKNAEQEGFDASRIDEDYDNSKDVIRWELIRKKIVEENNIRIEEEELLEEARRNVINRMNQMGYQIPEDRIDEMARRVLANEAEAEKIINFLYEMKALEFLKANVSLQEEPIAYSEFIKLLENKQAEELV